MKPRIYTTKEIDKMNLKPIRLSPIISGVYRANKILITASEYSSGIKTYYGYF